MDNNMDNNQLSILIIKIIVVPLHQNNMAKI